MSNEDNLLNSIETSNLIDFNSPDVNQLKYPNLVKPLIPAPQNIRILLPPRDSLENNPFDKVFKETNLRTAKNDDPFEIVFEKAYSESDRSNIKRHNTYTLESKITDKFNDSLNLSLSMLNDSVFTELSESVNKNLKITPQLTPSPLRCAAQTSENNSLNIRTPENIEPANLSAVFRGHIDRTSPIRHSPEFFKNDFKCLRRAYSNSALSNNCHALSDSIRTPSILNEAFQTTSLHWQDSDQLLRTYTIDSDSLENQSENLDRAFHEQLIRRPSYGINSNLSNPLVGPRSLSARKPTRYELGLMGSLRRSCLTNPKLFTFQKRLDNLASKNYKELYEQICKKKTEEELNASILFEAKQLAETFSKAADGSLTLDEKSTEESIENELLTSNPNWEILDDLDIQIPLDVEKKVEKDDIFRKIDKIFPVQPPNSEESPRQDITQENVNKKIENNENLDEEKSPSAIIITKPTPKKSHTSKKKDHTIELLENLTELLKNNENTKESKKQLKKKLITSLSNVLANDDVEEDLDSTVSVDSEDDLVEAPEEPKKPTRSVSFNLKPLAEVNRNIVGNQTNRTKSWNYEPPVEKKPPVISNKNSNLMQKIGQKLRPKRGAAVNQSENKENHNKGPLKAVIPLNNMAKDAAKIPFSSKLNGTDKNSKAEISKSKIKPMAQSTPTTTTANSKRKIRGPSNCSVSPIVQNSPSEFKTPTSMPPQSTPINTSRLLRKPSSLDNISNISLSSPKKTYKKTSINSTLSSFPSSSEGSSEIFEKPPRKLTSVQSSGSISTLRKTTPSQLIRRKSASEIIKSNKISNTAMKPILNGKGGNKTSEIKPLSFFSKIRRSYSSPSGKNNGSK